MTKGQLVNLGPGGVITKKLKTAACTKAYNTVK